MLNKKAESEAITILLYAFVLGIIGVIAVSIISEQTSKDTNPTGVINEPLNIASARLSGNNINQSVMFTLQNLGLKDSGGWVVNSVSIKNATGATIAAGNYSVNYTSQRINFINTTYMVSGGGSKNDTWVDYRYYQDSYLQQQFARSILNNILVGVFAILILLGIIGLLYLFLRKIKE